MSSLLEPITVGGKLPLRSRVVMGSMTRNRCIDNHKPGPAQVKHYADRAKDGTGLIVTEGTFIDWTGSEFAHAPVLITKEHADAWRKVTGAVHQVGGKIFCQVWHAGRCQHDQIPLMQEHDGRVLAPSAIRAEAGKYRDLPGQPVRSTPPVYLTTALLTNLSYDRDTQTMWKQLRMSKRSLILTAVQSLSRKKPTLTE